MGTSNSAAFRAASTPGSGSLVPRAAFVQVRPAPGGIDLLIEGGHAPPGIHVRKYGKRRATGASSEWARFERPRFSCARGGLPGGVWSPWNLPAGIFGV